jgi:hypothetical protein
MWPCVARFAGSLRLASSTLAAVQLSRVRRWWYVQPVCNRPKVSSKIPEVKNNSIVALGHAQPQ